MKLIESISGNGEVLENETNIGNVDYQLNVFQEIIGDEEGMKSAEGTINFSDKWKILQLLQSDNLVLVLQDGRCIKFSVVNSNGDIRCSGGFFQRER